MTSTVNLQCALPSDDGWLTVFNTGTPAWAIRTMSSMSDSSLAADTQTYSRPPQRKYRKILPTPSKIEDPPPTRPGFTRTPMKEDLLECPRCCNELIYPYWFTLCGHVRTKFRDQWILVDETL